MYYRDIHDQTLSADHVQLASGSTAVELSVNGRPAVTILVEDLALVLQYLAAVPTMEPEVGQVVKDSEDMYVALVGTRVAATARRSLAGHWEIAEPGKFHFCVDTEKAAHYALELLLRERDLLWIERDAALARHAYVEAHKVEF